MRKAKDVKEKHGKCKGCNLKKYACEEENKFHDVKIFEIVHEDDEKDGFIVNYALNPEVDGHLVVQPKFHVEQLCDLCEDQAVRLMEIIWASCKALQKCISPKKTYVYSFNETENFHFHVHIKPKNIDITKKGPDFVNWKDPKIEEAIKAIEQEKSETKKRKMKIEFKKHHAEIAKEIRENEFIKKLRRG